MSTLSQAILQLPPVFQVDQDRDHTPGLHKQSGKTDTADTLIGGFQLAQGSDLGGLTLR